MLRLVMTTTDSSHNAAEVAEASIRLSAIGHQVTDDLQAASEDAVWAMGYCTVPTHASGA